MKNLIHKEVVHKISQDSSSPAALTVSPHPKPIPSPTAKTNISPIGLVIVYLIGFDLFANVIIDILQNVFACEFENDDKYGGSLYGLYCPPLTTFLIWNIHLVLIVMLIVKIYYLKMKIIGINFYMDHIVQDHIQHHKYCTN